MLLFVTGHPATALTKTVAAKPRHGFRDISLCRNFHKIEDNAFGAGTPVARILPPRKAAADAVCVGRQIRARPATPVAPGASVQRVLQRLAGLERRHL